MSRENENGNEGNLNRWKLELVFTHVIFPR